MSKQIFSGKRNVKRMELASDYLAIFIREYDHENPVTVSLTRYGVPGRVNAYRFEWVSGKDFFGSYLRYSTSADMSLSKAVEMVCKDLDRKLVVELLKTAATEEYPSGDMFRLLKTLAPKSKSTKAVKALRVRLAAKMLTELSKVCFSSTAVIL